MNNKNTQLNFSAGIIAVGLIVAAIILTGGPVRFEGTASLVEAQPGYKEFNVVMQNNRYDPSTLTVDLGDTVVINFTNQDNVAHAVEIPHFNATIPGGHVFPGQPARMEFIADKRIRTDIATCGGPNPSDKTDDHGEELTINVI